MHEPLGVSLIVAGMAGGIVLGAVLRTRLPVTVVAALLVAAGAIVGAGALLVQTAASTVDWVLTLAFLGMMGPFQARMVFGPLGRTAPPPSGTVGPD